MIRAHIAPAATAGFREVGGHISCLKCVWGVAHKPGTNGKERCDFRGSGTQSEAKKESADPSFYVSCKEN